MSSRDRKDWNSFLAQLSKRDAPVELAKRRQLDDEKRITYRSRMFAVESEGTIIVERPDQAVVDHAFIVGKKLDLLLVLNNQRMIGACELLGIETRQINKHTKVTCFKLGPALRPTTEQRRGYFRVNTAATDLGPVILKPASGKDEIKARLVNLGGGGIGVSVRGNRQMLRELREETDFVTEINIHEDDSQLELHAKLIHITPLDSTGLYLGMRFALPGSNEGREIEKKLVQYATWLQRQQLRKRRA